MQLFIIRHGDPDYANDSLTPVGRLEAQALATRMAKQIQPDVLYSSPLGRARATMEPTEKILSKRGTILEWTRELSLWTQDGPWGLATAQWDVAGHWIRNTPKLPIHDDWHRHPPFDDQTVRNDFQRVKTASDDFIGMLGYQRDGGRYACVAANRQKVAVFCHGALGLTWIAHLLEIPLTLMWSSFWLPPSSVTTILFDERVSEWATPRCIGLGDLSHLYEAGLARSNMGLKANYD